MNDEEELVAELVRTAFAGVKLGSGVGLREAQGIDDYADADTVAAYRAQDEKLDWARFAASDLDRCESSLSFFNADGMRFHLPAYLLADLACSLQTACPLFHLTYAEHDGNRRFASLSTAQRQAVREFLLLRFNDPHREFEHEMIGEALRDYWQ
jgi:hypothetical protein